MKPTCNHSYLSKLVDSLAFSYLRLFDRSVVSVAHGADVKTLFTFAIALQKEFGHDSVNPDFVQ